LRALLLLVWPQIGLWFVGEFGPHLPGQWAAAMLAWAVGSGLFYSWRMLSARDFDIWTAFYATSAYALGWLGLTDGRVSFSLHAAMACLSVTAVSLLFSSHCIRRRWGDAYLGLRPGLGRAMPRLGATTTLAVLAALGAPIFPVFFAMLYFLGLGSAPTVAGVLLVWLTWSWAGAQVWQGFLFGRERASNCDTARPARDISSAATLFAALLALAAIVAAAVWSLTWLMH
jgi:hypothetical protein